LHHTDRWSDLVAQDLDYSAAFRRLSASRNRTDVTIADLAKTLMPCHPLPTRRDWLSGCPLAMKHHIASAQIPWVRVEPFS
jgi:hypothetical protein